MLYLGIDQHARQITVSLRDDQGDVILARQVSTQWEKINAFFQHLTREQVSRGESFIAVVEVCGFNDWLIRMLRDYRCHQVILIQPEERKRRKTDRRDAAALSELLWVNRDRFLQGKPIRGLRQVDIASTSDQQTRRLTTLRKDVGRARTRVINKIRHILRRHNLQWEMPTKRFPTLKAIVWLKKLVFPQVDQLEINHLLADLEHFQQQFDELENMIAQRCDLSESATLLTSIPGVAQFTATSLACRIGRPERFPRAHSLANYWGLTPGCRNSGENNQRLGHITKSWQRHCPRGSDAQTSHDHLAHADQEQDVCRMSRIRHRLSARSPPLRLDKGVAPSPSPSHQPWEGEGPMRGRRRRGLAEPHWIITSSTKETHKEIQ
jgi:transposase